MKKAVLFLWFVFASLRLFADVGYGYIYIYKTNGQVDSVAVDGIYHISHSMEDLDGRGHNDFVTMVISTSNEERKYLIDEIEKVVTPIPLPWETVKVGSGTLPTGSSRRKIYFKGTYPATSTSKTEFKWKENDGVYIHMANQDTAYHTKLETMTADSTWAWFETVKVRKKEEPLVIYYPGRTGAIYNKVKIASLQEQAELNSTMHIDTVGDCATDTAEYDAATDIYRFVLNHHSTYFAFLLHNDRIPSVKLKSVTMVTEEDKPIAGTFTFDSNNGINLNSVEEDKSNKITLRTPYFFDDGWKHTPRKLEHAQDSTAAYMVVAPQKQRGSEGVKFDLIFNVVDTLSLIDTVYVKSYKLAQLKPNTVYSVDVNIPDTLFSIVDLGLGDIKYSFRNVESYFERGPVKFYGGAFAYGESNTKNDYSLGGDNKSNYNGGAVDQEFTAKYDAAYQRWGGCWRLMQTLEADSLLKYCKTEWTEYNGVEGALITGPSGKRIFLPVSDITRNYWAINRSKQIEDFRYWVPGTPGYYVYRDIPIVGIDKNRTDSTVYHNAAKFYDPGYARGVIEYSNYLKSNTTYDGSLMLLRHLGEEEASNGNFTINGMVRSARPWPTASTSVHLYETGFIFGTDSATLYYNKDFDKAWADTLFSSGPGVDFLYDTYDVDGKTVNGHVKLKAGGDRYVGAYAGNQQTITVQLSSDNFLGYLDKEKKYFVREYFTVYNSETGDYDYYYASKATQLQGFYPHTDSIRWVVNDQTATFNGKVVGVSAEVAGKVGFVIQEVDKANDIIKQVRIDGKDVWTSTADSVYQNLTITGSELYLSDDYLSGVDPRHVKSPGDIRTDMKFSRTIQLDLTKKKYYIARAVFVTFGEDMEHYSDATFVYAPEVTVLSPLDTVDLDLDVKWATLDVEAQYPEDHDSTYVWNSGGALPDVITDIGGTDHDIAFRKWYGEDGWVFTMPSKEQMEALLKNCSFTAMQRFGRDVMKVDGTNGNYIFMPYIDGTYYNYFNSWTSQRPTGSAKQAYYAGVIGSIGQVNVTNKYWVRPVLQTNCQLRDGSLLFISTDTLSRSTVDRGEMTFWGRALGVTKEIKNDYQVTRGFVLHDFKGGTLDDPCGDMPDTSTEDATSDNYQRYNGLYSVELTDGVKDTLQSDKDYWYRAYIKICKKDGTDCQSFYGDPKKLSPLTVDIDTIFWEVHEKEATLGCVTDGTVFIKTANSKLSKLVKDDKTLDIDGAGTKLGFIVGDSATIDLQNYETIWEYQYKENEVITDSAYRVKMNVPIDTVYWVRAYVVADGKIRYSAARQFGLDYVDLGLPSKRLWANISVGAAYPEDDCDYYSLGESLLKSAYHEKTFLDDTLKYVRTTSGDLMTTSERKWINLTCKSNNGDDYTVTFRGAEHNKYDCEGELYWKQYSGTKNDAAYVNWGNDNSKFANTTKYIENTKYGNLFVEPDQEEWEELRDECVWTLDNEFGVAGWRVTGSNGNSIFLPFKGHKGSSYSVKDGSLIWTTDTAYYNSAGFYHVANGKATEKDSVMMVSINSSTKLSSFDKPSSYDSWTLTWGEFYQGFSVRPIARYNLPLTKGADKLRDETLVYLNTDTCYYLNYRTAVALQGSYRINYPIREGDYNVGFVVGDRADVTYDDALIKVDKAQKLTGSQYFVVLDHKDNLESDKTYYYRLFLHTGGQYYYTTEADTFHLADQVTGAPNWTMYSSTATVNGTVQGVLKNEAQSSGFKAGIIISKKRDLKATDSDLLKNIDCTSQLNDYNGSKGGPITGTYTLSEDATYYFRTYVYYNGSYHYGDVNLFGYELVDLGLSSGKKWASINVGGYNPNNGLSTSAIGESHGVGVYGDANQPTRNSGPGGPKDKAHTLWHNVNRMPYSSEAQELLDECTWEADTLYGCPGVRCTGPNGNSIFFRQTIKYFQHNDHSDYSLCYNYYYIDENRHKAAIHGVPYHGHGCHGIDFERPIWESNIQLDNATQDELLIRTDDAIVHSQVDYVTFFGSFIGAYQQRLGGSMYQVSDIQHAGFIVGSDTLVTHNNGYKKYDFPHEDVKTDTIFYYDRQNINIFKVDSTYWVRAYVKIGDQYYYGRSIKFVRQPNIETGDVEWAVGKTSAVLHGSVIGFNKDDVVIPEDLSDDEKQELKDMQELTANARVGILVGYDKNLDETTPESALLCTTVGGKAIKGFFDLGEAGNRSFQVEVPYPKDTTYYYRAYIYYNGKYVFGKHTNHYGLEFVDLGLPMQWASISVGSRFAEDNCEQYAWGDTITGSTFKFDNYRFYYPTGDDEYNNLGNEIKGSLHDVAHVKWNYTWDASGYGGRGSLWAMPSEEDLQMLADSCEWSDSTSVGLSGAPVVGYKVTGPNGKSIFINKTRCDEWTISGYHSSLYGPWEYGPLWSSSRAPRERNAFGLQTGSKDGEKAKQLLKYHYRYHGHYVRPMAHINVTLPSGKKLSITTERTSWIAGAEAATIYGCVLGLNSTVKGTCGFVVGRSKDNLESGKSGVETYVCQTNSSNVGLFSYTITPLDNNRMYYFRAFVQVNGKYYYGDVKEFGIVMVDLGLTSGTKWANVNMGSWRDKDHGDFYAWGETNTKDVFTLDGYKYYNTLTGNYRDLGTNISGNDTTDVANKLLGGLWRMAGDEEWQELMTECDWTPDTVGHIPGFRVKSKKNSNNIFLPSNYYNPGERDANFDLETNENGSSSNNHDNEVTHRGYYWSSNRSASYKQAREVLFIDSIAGRSVLPQIVDNARWRGNSIRPVAAANRGDFYLRTEGTDWRYQKDSVNFYSIVLNMPVKGYETGILVGTSAEMTQSTAGVLRIKSKQSTLGGGDYVAILPKEERNLRNDGVYYYRAYIVDSTKLANDAAYLYGDSKQFGLVQVDLGIDGLQWANINVDAASPEEIGLNGTPTGKYANVDPAYAEFGSLWRTPTDEEKQKLLDECDWTQNDDAGKPITLYGTQVWKVSNKNDATKFIYLTSNNPAEWGYRALTQSNLQFDDEKTVYLRTDSTNWRAGYDDSDLYATLVGSTDVLGSIVERGFVIGTSANVTHTTDFTKAVSATAEEISTSAYSAVLPELPVGTYYYRAYVKYSDGKYYYVEPSDAKQIGIDFVDLGLSSGVKWANVNIGSTVASDAGDNYAWGDTEVRSKYTVDTYPHYNSSTGYTDIGADISSTAYDVATTKIEGTRMPTQSELAELIANCTWTSAALNGVSGYRVTSIKANDDGTYNSIFLPMGDYWTSTQFTSDNSKAYDLSEYLKNSTLTREQQTALRYLGKMVRPVASRITTLDATDRTTTTAVLHGIVNADGYTEVGFKLSRSSAMTGSETKIVTKSDNGAYSYTAEGLAEGNMYYYQAYVVVDGKTYYGAVKSFATLSDEDMKAVDLGLSVKWADRNVGATLPEKDGDFYAWGELQKRQSYTAVTYTHYSDGSYHNIGKDISASEWDIATKTYNGCWRMPTQAEVQELLNSCSWTWSTKEGVPGYWVENAASHQNIFLPAAGYYNVTYNYNNDSWGHYWASTVGGDNALNATSYALSFSSTSKVSNTSGVRISNSSNNANNRYYGFTVRPVYDSNGAVDGQDVFIRTDSITYAGDRTANTLYGTMLGLNSEADGLTQGFVIGTSRTVDLSTTVIDGVSQTATANGSYSLTLTDAQLQTLTVGDVYYVRAYVSKNGDTKYGDAVEMTDYTFFTDSVQWGLGNAGKLYAHVKGVKPASGLEVGFFYSTNSDMSNSKSVSAAFGTGDEANVFTGTIDTVKVATYYYQAYTKYEGITHKGEVKSFGAKVVDLGLPSGVKWVDMNLGSDNEEKKGDGYRWGEIAPNQDGTYKVSSDRSYIGGTGYDAAHTRLGTDYRLPSIDNIQELLDECDWSWDVTGYRVTSRKDRTKSIFLPVGSYWSSQQGTGVADTQALTLKIDTTNRTPDAAVDRTTLLLLRPTLNPDKVDVTGEGGNAGMGENGGESGGSE